MGDLKQHETYHSRRRLSLLKVGRLESFVIDFTVAWAILPTSSVSRRTCDWLGSAVTAHGGNDASVPEGAFGLRGSAPARLRAQRTCRAGRAAPGYRF